jgi:hypothetical protein
MIVVNIKKSKSDKYSKCEDFVSRNGKEMLGDDVKVVSNSECFKVYSGKRDDFDDGVSVELVIKKTINLKEDNEEEFYRKLQFFFENCNKIMENFTNGN